MDYSQLFTLRICQLCREKGYSINKLSNLCGLRQSTLNNIISGASKNPKVYTLQSIANAFNMTLSEFLDFPEMNLFSDSMDSTTDS